MNHGFELKEARYTVQGKSIVDDVSLALEPGLFTVLVGPNGAGKTSLLRLITGEVKPTSGHVTYDGKPLGDHLPATLASIRAVMSQSVQVSFPFTVHEVVKLGTMGRRDQRREILSDVINTALGQVNLDGYAGRSYHNLSGGEQQRVQLARALSQLDGPVIDGVSRFLILDEPISSLDLKHQLDVMA